MQDQIEMLNKHIDFLKSLDIEEFYNKDEDDVRRYAHNTIQEFIQLGTHATNELIELLHTEFTWSCFFALTIFRETKDPQAVPAIISFLKKESDDSMANEEAMFALQDIGDPSIIPLIEDLEEAFDNKKYNSYLIGALTGIIGPAPYDFMVKITKDFISKPWRYKGWFHIEDFTYNFVKQGRQDAIPLLKQVLDVKVITGTEKRELEDTIRALEDPVSYEKKIQETAKELSEATRKVDL
ncbi:MAG: HEAT repeat domain-containing protein [Thermoplasmata archaeon]|nr:HEAT repeat domain-containing protein [Thermoplasmata archaeon]MBE3142065.1 HEAT repeat domain-containing protein [Thermoplasmata archaeon]